MRRRHGSRRSATSRNGTPVSASMKDLPCLAWSYLCLRCPLFCVFLSSLVVCSVLGIRILFIYIVVVSSAHLVVVSIVMSQLPPSNLLCRSCLHSYVGCSNSNEFVLSPLQIRSGTHFNCISCFVAGGRCSTTSTATSAASPRWPAWRRSDVLANLLVWKFASEI